MCTHACVVSIALPREWPLLEFNGNLWEQAIGSHTLPLGLAHIHTDAHPPFPFPSTQTEPRIPAWAHHSWAELRDETATLCSSLQCLPRHVQHSNAHFISHNKLSIVVPHPIPLLYLYLSLHTVSWSIRFHPDPRPLLLFLFSIFSPSSPLQQWRMMTSTPFHLTSCKTHAESHWTDSVSTRTAG